MKILITIARILVGALFIFSGFIKLNDPVGFSFKLQEYFSADVLNLEFLSPYALLMAIILVVVEVLLGVALLIGYARKLTLALLLAMILFFTFLTFYSAYFNKVTDCGCFGDAIPLVPWESFIKDVILLVLILFLIWGRKHITPIFSKMGRAIIVLLSFFACMLFGVYVLEHLPWLDFRAYKEGSNIAEGMVVPEGAPEAIFEYQWKFNIDGKEEVITTTGAYPQVDGEFIDYETKLIQEGYEPPVHDFTIERDDTDYTTTYLEKENLIAIVAYNLDKTEREAYYDIKRITEDAIRQGYEVIGLSSSGADVQEQFVRDYKLPFDFYFTDETVLKTIIRSNPGIVSLDKATIKQKLHWNDADDLELHTLPNAKPKLDFDLKFTLDSIGYLDQKYRKLMQYPEGPEREALGKSMGLAPEDYTGNLWERQTAIDTANLRMIERILQSQGYPGKEIVGEPTNTVAWYVIQHNPEKIPDYLDTMKQAGKTDEIPFRLVAMMEDRYLMNEGKPQVYGTQGAQYPGTTAFIWPIENPEQVNERRKTAGFGQSIEEYGKRLFGDEFEYEVLTLEEAEQLKSQLVIPDN